MINAKDALKVSWKESSYKKTLSKEELSVYKSLSRERKDEVVFAWMNDNPVDLLDNERVESINNGTLTQELTNTKSTENLELFGFTSPSLPTLNAYNHLRIGEKYNNFANAVGMFTTDIHKQLKANFYNTQQSQMFLLSAQNDELIKQNDKVISQNEQIIELLQQLVNK